MRIFSSAPFRIRRRKRDVAVNADPPVGGSTSAFEGVAKEGGEAEHSTPAERILRLIPGEVILIYTAFRTEAVRSTLPSDEEVGTTLWFSLFQCVCLSVLILVRYAGSRDRNVPTQKPQLGGIAIAAVSFCIWITALGDPLFGIELSFVPLFILQALSLAWAIVVPLFYKGSES